MSPDVSSSSSIPHTCQRWSSRIRMLCGVCKKISGIQQIPYPNWCSSDLVPDMNECQCLHCNRNDRNEESVWLSLFDAACCMNCSIPLCCKLPWTLSKVVECMSSSKRKTLYSLWSMVYAKHSMSKSIRGGAKPFAQYNTH